MKCGARLRCSARTMPFYASPPKPNDVMTTPATHARLASTRLALCSVLLAFLVAGCQPESTRDDTDDIPDPVDTDDSGTVELALAVRSLSYTQANPGPTQAVLDVRVPTEATVQLVLNDELIEEWDTGEACIVFPAFIQCADYVDQSLPVMIETGGEQQFELTALKGGEWKTVTFNRNLSLGQCISNEAFYTTKAQGVLQSQCGSCHNGGNPVFSAGASWSQFETTIFNSTHRLYKAPSHQENGHNAQPLEPYDADYRAIAELVWRSLNEFECS